MGHRGNVLRARTMLPPSPGTKTVDLFVLREQSGDVTVYCAFKSYSWNIGFHLSMFREVVLIWYGFFQRKEIRARIFFQDSIWWDLEGKIMTFVSPTTLGEELEWLFHCHGKEFANFGQNGRYETGPCEEKSWLSSRWGKSLARNFFANSSQMTPQQGVIQKSFLAGVSPRPIPIPAAEA